MDYRRIPTVTDIINTPTIHDLALTPDGNRIAYVVRTPDWDENRYVVTCVVYDLRRNETLIQIADAWHPRWLDEETLAVLHYVDGAHAVNHEDKPQIWLFPALGGPGVQRTSSPWLSRSAQPEPIVQRAATFPSHCG